MSNFTIIDQSNKSPLVSIAMITYNHAEFINQAIDSVLMQKCDYEFKIIIAEDCSTDNTRAIILDYQKRFPDKIKLILQNNNVGAYKNNLDLLQNLEGSYIAALEGDDYWTDPLKLQKQVSFLEEHPDYNMTVGRYQLLYQNTGKTKNSMELFNINRSLSLKNYIAFNFGHTSTFLFRNNFEFPDWLNAVFSGDQSVFIINTRDKKIKYFSDFFSVYRVNDGGVTSSIKAQQSVKNTENFLNIIDDYTGRKYHLLINNRKRLNKLYYHFESTTNGFKRNMLRVPIILFRWIGINLLVKFVKD